MTGFTLRATPVVATGVVFILGGCSVPDPEPATISLVEQFPDARLENRVDPGVPPQRQEWRFDGEGAIEATDDDPTGGWRALNAVDGLTIEDGRLSGRTGENALVVAPAPSTLEADDLLHAVEIRMRTSEGERLGVELVAGDLDENAAIGQASSSPLMALNQSLVNGDDFQTYTLTADDSSMAPSFAQSRIQHLLIRPSDAPDAEFAIESVRLISRREHLATVESGVGWQGLGEIYRETLVMRAPERLVFSMSLPSEPRLELHAGTIEGGATTFVVEVGGDTVLRRTVTRSGVWHPIEVDLGPRGGEPTEIALSLESEGGRVGYWGGVSVRNAAGAATRGEPSRGRQVLTAREAPPRGVILILADTLRRDHLEPWGHDRATAPTLVRVASEGALFRDAIAQGPWTKVSASSILTSLYPPTHGLVDMADRLPASVTTVAEAFRAAGYATFATSSVPFTGKLTNLHQGVDVLHERPSIEDLDQGSAKTARTFVDRLLPWIEAHHDVPFFAFLHVFDPHSPFEPAEPYSSMWMDPDTRAEFREDMRHVAEHVEDPFMKMQSLPTAEELEASGVDRETYLAREKIWYDASILAMDVELARLFERLDALGLGEDTLVALVSDHGEEFLEHGRSFHGSNIYGEHTNVPMMVWWPGVVPPTTVDDTVETIDLVPTLLELARVQVPEEMQGRSLLPLLVDADQRDGLEFVDRPAFSERRSAPGAFNEDEDDRFEQISLVFDGWRLVKNFQFREGHREIELYDHVEDPLNLVDVADDHRDVVSELLPELERWYQRATLAKVEPDSAADMSPEELERLRALGYVR